MNDTTGRAHYLHVTNPDSIPGNLYGLQVTSATISESKFRCGPTNRT